MAGDVRELPLEVFERRPRRFRVEDFDVLEVPETLDLVKGLFPRQGVGFVAGPWASAKSVFVLDTLARICRGEPVLGRRTMAAGALYVASEGAAGVRKRLVGLRQERGELGGRLKMIGTAPDLTNPDDLAELRETIEAVQTEMRGRGFDLGVVAIDTLSASIPGADENASGPMSAVMAALQGLAADLGLFVLVVAHTGKDAQRGVRGWSGLGGNADALVIFDEPEDGLGFKPGETRKATVRKVKDAEAGDRFAFDLKRVVLGVDSDGDEISTVVADFVEVGEGVSSRRLTPLKPRLEIMLRAVGQLMDSGEVGEVPPGPGIPPGTKGVLRSAVKVRALELGFGDTDEKPETTRRLLNDALADLIGRHRKLRQETDDRGEWIWPV
jgi:hypothetical protein